MGSIDSLYSTWWSLWFVSGFTPPRTNGLMVYFGSSGRNSGMNYAMSCSFHVFTSCLGQRIRVIWHRILAVYYETYDHNCWFCCCSSHSVQLYQQQGVWVSATYIYTQCATNIQYARTNLRTQFTHTRTHAHNTHQTCNTTHNATSQAHRRSFRIDHIIKLMRGEKVADTKSSGGSFGGSSSAVWFFFFFFLAKLLVLINSRRCYSSVGSGNYVFHQQNGKQKEALRGPQCRRSSLLHRA